MDYVSLGLFGLLLVGFLSATILPFSSEAIFILFLQQNYPFFESILFVSLGNCLGGMFTFWMGYKGRDVMGKLKKWPKTESFVHTYGSLSALLSWLPIIGDPLLIFLGFFKAPVVLTLILMSIGKVVRYIFIALVYFYW